MLEIRNVHKTFNPGTINEKHALNGVNLKLEEGDFVTVIGGNGAGKSTMLNAVAGTWPVDDGSILIDGVDVTGLPEFKRASFLGRVFQDPMTGTTATMQIDENLALAARRGKRRGLGWGITKAEKERFHELLKELDLGLEDRMTSKVGLLSGGQRQAVTLLMASLQKPKVLLLDEHTAALDPKTASKVLALTDKIINENSLTAMMVTHNMRDAIAHGNRLIMMNNGQVVLNISGEEKKNLTVEDLLMKLRRFPARNLLLIRLCLDRHIYIIIKKFAAQYMSCNFLLYTFYMSSPTGLIISALIKPFMIRYCSIVFTQFSTPTRSLFSVRS